MSILPTGGTPANPIVSVFKNKFYRGADSLDAADLVPCEPLRLDDALARHYTTDAHFAGYFVAEESSWPRLNKAILPVIRAAGRDILSGAMIFDFDTPGHKPWRFAVESKIFELRLREIGEKCDALKYSVFYETRKGARTIIPLVSPLPVDEAELFHTWAVEQFIKYGISEIDKGCSDWTRLFRLPNVTRDSGTTWTEELPCE